MVAAAAASAAGVVGLLVPSASAQADDVRSCTPADYVSVIEVSGLIDRVLVDFVGNELTRAEARCAVALVLQLNSRDAITSEDRLDDLVDQIGEASVPMDVWVGPSGSEALGGATRLLAAARTVGVAPGSRVELTRDLLGDTALDGEAAVGDKVNAETAVSLGVADSDAPTIGEFVLSLDGVQSEVVDTADGPQRQQVTQAISTQLPLMNQLMHTAASPPVAYLLFVIGLALIVFELFTAGVGIAGMVGASSLVLGSYGLAELPTNPIGVALLVFAMLGYAIDVQTGVPRIWSAIATVAFALGSLVLYDGISLSWVTLLVGIVGMALAMVGGMPSMVRTRFSTPTIGREWMVGEAGSAVTAVDPDGTVTVRAAPWRAHTSRATPIEAGDGVRVVGIDGLVLQVEPVDDDVPPSDP